MLTLEGLKGMEEGVIFAKGVDLIIHPWFNDAKENLVNEDGESDENGRHVKVNWVAILGNFHDWAIYHSLDANLTRSDYLDGFEHLLATDTQIADHGAKIHNEEVIKKFVPCDEESFKMYRH